MNDEEVCQLLQRSMGDYIARLQKAEVECLKELASRMKIDLVGALGAWYSSTSAARQNKYYPTEMETCQLSNGDWVVKVWPILEFIEFCWAYPIQEKE